MWVFPLAAAAVSGCFGGALAVRWRERHSPHLLAWSLALAMFGIASAAAAVRLRTGWTPNAYRIYYLFGAIANVPVLALGTIYLLTRRPIAHVCAIVVAMACLGAAVAIANADVSSSGLGTGGVPRGSEVLTRDVRLLSRYYSITGFVVVVGGAVWSAVRLLRRRASPEEARRRQPPDRRGDDGGCGRERGGAGRYRLRAGLHLRGGAVRRRVRDVPWVLEDAAS